MMLGFPIAFTLMAMGVSFGFYAYYDQLECRWLLHWQLGRLG
jgi:TRAP-type mannitol/chloroaromatic compound transport system permease large subunit